MKSRRRMMGWVVAAFAGAVLAGRRSGTSCGSCPPLGIDPAKAWQCPSPADLGLGRAGTPAVSDAEPRTSKTAGMGSALGLAVAGLLFLVSGCHRESAESSAQASSRLPAMEVKVAAASAGKRQAVEEVVGTVRARKRSTVEAKVSGRIASMTAVPGRAAKAGEVLVEIDAQEITARLDQAKAVLQQAEREYARFSSLFKQEAVTKAEFDAVEARLRVAKAAVAEAETLGGYTRVTAPFDGVVVRKLSEVGDLAGPGRGLLEIEDPASVRLEADVPLQLVDRVKLGDRLTVSGVSLKEQSHQAVVSEIEPTADAVSRTFRIKLDLPPDAGARAGAFGRVSVPVSESVVLRVPRSAVIARGQMELAFVADQGVARLRLIKTGKTEGGEVEILSGLEVGERVIVDVPVGLVDGQPVNVR